MKRVVAAILILIGIIITSGYSYITISEFNSAAVPTLENALKAAESGSTENATALAFKFQDIWKNAKTSLEPFSHEEIIAKITSISESLPHISKQNNLSDFITKTNELLSTITLL